MPEQTIQLDLRRLSFAIDRFNEAAGEVVNAVNEQLNEVKAAVRNQAKPIQRQQYMGALKTKLIAETMPEVMLRTDSARLPHDQWLKIYTQTYSKIVDGVAEDYESRIWPAIEARILAQYRDRLSENAKIVANNLCSILSADGK